MPSPNILHVTRSYFEREFGTNWQLRDTLSDHDFGLITLILLMPETAHRPLLAYLFPDLPVPDASKSLFFNKDQLEDFEDWKVGKYRKYTYPMSNALDLVLRYHINPDFDANAMTEESSQTKQRYLPYYYNAVTAVRDHVVQPMVTERFYGHVIPRATYNAIGFLLVYAFHIDDRVCIGLRTGILKQCAQEVTIALADAMGPEEEQLRESELDKFNIDLASALIHTDIYHTIKNAANDHFGRTLSAIVLTSPSSPMREGMATAIGSRRFRWADFEAEFNARVEANMKESYEKQKKARERERKYDEAKEAERAKVYAHPEIDLDPGTGTAAVLSVRQEPSIVMRFARYILPAHEIEHTHPQTIVALFLLGHISPGRQRALRTLYKRKLSPASLDKAADFFMSRDTARYPTVAELQSIREWLTRVAKSTGMGRTRVPEKALFINRVSDVIAQHVGSKCPESTVERIIELLCVFHCRIDLAFCAMFPDRICENVRRTLMKARKAVMQQMEGNVPTIYYDSVSLNYLIQYILPCHKIPESEGA